MNVSLLLLISICFIGMVSPGPDFLLVTKNALLYPRRQAIATALGVVSGCLIHASYCILGLAFIITQSIMLYTMIKYAGAAYLIYLGIKGLKSKSIPKMTDNTVSIKSVTVSKAYMEGLLCNTLNPKLAVFLLSLFTQFVSINASLGDKAIVVGVFVGESALYWPSLVMFLQSDKIQKIFTKSQAMIGRVFGGLLIYLGIRVMLSVD